MIVRTFEPGRDESAAENFCGSGQGSRGVRGSNSRATGRKVLSKQLRGVVSVFLILHLVAIASAPLAMEPASLPAQKVFAFFRPYLDVAFLNHGYHFFTPEPGPSHLIRYELTFSDGRVEGGVFPNSAEQKPRLNYHRHFMLSEFANQLAVDDAQQSALHELSQSFARHLMSERNAESATLFLRRHYIPTPQQVQEGVQLDADELYAERPLGTFLFDTGSRVGSLTGDRSVAGAVDSRDAGATPAGREPASVRLSGRLDLPGDLQAGEVIR